MFLVLYAEHVVNIVVKSYIQLLLDLPLQVLALVPVSFPVKFLCLFEYTLKLLNFPLSRSSYVGHVKSGSNGLLRDEICDTAEDDLIRGGPIIA